MKVQAASVAKVLDFPLFWKRVRDLYIEESPLQKEEKGEKEEEEEMFQFKSVPTIESQWAGVREAHLQESGQIINWHDCKKGKRKRAKVLRALG